MDIDLVYLWVDGNDPAWLAKKLACTGAFKEGTETDCKARYESNDELKYSLRSAEKYVPWIRKIFIITDNQIPVWLDTSNPKIQIIDHKDIMPEVCLPCFNSRVIESCLYKIPNLSEHFLYANDDMFFNSKLLPDFFFNKSGFPIIRLKRRRFGKMHYKMYCFAKWLTRKKRGNYRTAVHKVACLTEQKFGKFYSGIPHHNIDAYNKHDFREAIENVFGEQAEKSLSHRLRQYDDLQRSVVSYYMLAIGHGQLKYIGRRESLRIPVQKYHFMKFLFRYQPKLFCLNDSQRTTDNDRERIKPFLEELFPEKSTFEK